MIPIPTISAATPQDVTLRTDMNGNAQAPRYPNMAIGKYANTPRINF